MKKLTGKNIVLLLCLMVIAGGGCRTTKTTIDSKDVSYIYNPLKNSINPTYSVLNQSDEQSYLQVKFFNSDLFFSEANPSGVPTAKIIILVRLYNISQGRVLADTAYYNFNIVKSKTRNDYLYKVPLSVEKGNEYIAEVKVMDQIRQLMVQAFIPFNTLSSLNRYNFFIKGHTLNNVLLKPIIKINDYFDIVYQREHIDSIYISVFEPYEEIPYPPSMVLPEKPVASEPDTVVALPYSDTLTLMFPRKGIYFCSVKRNINEGFTIFNFGPDFPGMNKPEDMIEPLAYLVSTDEMADLKSHPKPKIALDEFWLKCGGNVEKARELIRIYYTRVLYANYYFTSFKDGWRTDRGMIYIIYGPPDKIYKSSGQERWGYLKPEVKSRWGSRYSVKQDYIYFDFNLRNNKYSDNEYTLTRSETVITYWDQAVLSWRKGIVFRLDNPAEF
jgi:GWxTD domain-containing protein